MIIALTSKSMNSSAHPRDAAHSNHRLFVASVPPPDVVESLTAAVAPLRASAPTLRWSPPSRWHVTVAFLGPVPEHCRPELDRRLGRVAARHGRVCLSIAGGGRFGQRVLVAKISGELGPLAVGVRRAALRAGVTGLDTRPFQAHLTLARVPEGQHADPRTLAAALDVADCPSWTAEEIILFCSVTRSGNGEGRSHPSAPGPAAVAEGPHVDYRALAAWPLTGRRRGA
jgi:2'-5' RNA ligase